MVNQKVDPSSPFLFWKKNERSTVMVVGWDGKKDFCAGERMLKSNVARCAATAPALGQHWDRI
jgi:hypothetical protein